MVENVQSLQFTKEKLPEFFYPVLLKKKKNLFLFAFSFPVKICEFT